jgi:hypothetical protein
VQRPVAVIERLEIPLPQQRPLAVYDQLLRQWSPGQEELQ